MFICWVLEGCTHLVGFFSFAGQLGEGYNTHLGLATPANFLPHTNLSTQSFIPDISQHLWYLQGREILPAGVEVCLRLANQSEIQSKSYVSLPTH